MIHSPHLVFPADSEANVLILLRSVHLIAGIVWVGLLYFFNLVNFAFIQQLEPPLRPRVVPLLMTRALLWFRWSALVTFLAGLSYWMIITTQEAHNAGARPGPAFAWFFTLWTGVFAVEYVLIMVVRIANLLTIAIIMAVAVTAGGWLFLALNTHGWETNRVLSIGIGGGLGYTMLLAVWGIVWRINKRLIGWMREAASAGKPMPEQAALMMRQSFLTARLNAYLSLPMLFFMAAASHYPFLGS